MQVGQFAARAGLSPHTVRYYVRRGLLHPVRDGSNGYYGFASCDLRTLLFIRRAQSLGFTLDEIAAVLDMSHRQQSPCPMVRDIVRRRLDEFQVRLDELTETCRRMQTALARWHCMPDSVPTGDEICRLIEAIGDDP